MQSDSRVWGHQWGHRFAKIYHLNSEENFLSFINTWTYRDKGFKYAQAPWCAAVRKRTQTTDRFMFNIQQGCSWFALWSAVSELQADLKQKYNQFKNSICQGQSVVKSSPSCNFAKYPRNSVTTYNSNLKFKIHVLNYNWNFVISVYSICTGYPHKSSHYQLVSACALPILRRSRLKFFIHICPVSKNNTNTCLNSKCKKKSVRDLWSYCPRDIPKFWRLQLVAV